MLGSYSRNVLTTKLTLRLHFYSEFCLVLEPVCGDRKMLETHLRGWVKDVLGDLLSWVEPGRGVSVGVPDALVQLPDKSKIPVELKLWEVKSKGLECKMRPAQIRYHFMHSHKKQGPTAICYLVAIENEWKVFVLHGRDVPQDRYKHLVTERSAFVAKLGDRKESARVKLVNLLWSMK